MIKRSQATLSLSAEEFGSSVRAFISKNQELSTYLSPRYSIFPGFCDVHVHFREPGFSYKETIKSGSLAAAHGGYTAVCTMPNLNPTPHNSDNLALQEKLIKDGAVINVYPFGTITVDEAGCALADMEAIAERVVGFSDDGRGVQSQDIMTEAMKIAASLGKVISAHCEENSLLKSGYIHDGEYAKAHGHRGICSESEWVPIKRDIELVEKMGCPYHVCHISTKESVELIREAKKRGVNITCETAPHYLVMDDSELEEDGRFKMNPPIRSKQDKEALVEGILDGTIDMIATDHAPHSAEEKAKGLEKSPFGVVGLETAFQVMYTHFVKTGLMTIDKLTKLMVYNPRKRFGIPLGVDFSVWDLNAKTVINPDDFLSKGRATPFAGKEVYGECVLTVCGGKVVYKKM